MVTKVSDDTTDDKKSTKSHYFVQKPPEEQLGSSEYKICGICGRMFTGAHGNRKYCSKECQQEALRRTKASWFQANKEMLNKRRYKRRHSRGQRSKEEMTKHQKARKVRNRVIMRDLMNLELYTFQVKSATKLKKDHLNFQAARRKYNPPKCKLIKEKLQELELYTDQIKEKNSEPLDFDKQYHGVYIKF